MKKVILATCCVLLAANFALADWNEGDPYKMHYPQLPDPNGWDVQVTRPHILADDFKCTQSGPVNDVHFWGSWAADLVGNIASIHVSFHKDIPAGADGTTYSMPGEELWSRTFLPEQFTVRQAGEGDQGYFIPDPIEPGVFPNDHKLYFQVNIVDIEDPFYQHQGIIYWLDLQVTVSGPGGDFGWKSSLDHWNDDAVYGFWNPENPAPIQWLPLFDPLTGETLDLAFVITPEPGTIVLLVMGGLVGLARRKK